MTDDSELLFFDTFSHESSEDQNLDLVQFPRPVFVHEIRIIPLGTRVQADFPGGHRLGATNPSSFQLEFFVNDLYHRGACTFEKIGSFEYKQNVDIQFLVGKKIPTDGLVLRGSYSTITLAVYGVLTKVSKERSSPPPPPPPPQVTSRVSASDIREGSDFDRIAEPIPPAKTDWEHEQRIEGNAEPTPPPPPPPPPPPVHHHRPTVVEPIRYTEPPPIARVIPEKHPPYSDRGSSSYSDPIGKTYPHHPSSIHHGSSYGQQYELGTHYSKSWSSQNDTYPPKPEPYERVPPYDAQETRVYPPPMAHNPILPWEQRGDSRAEDLCRDSDKYRSRELDKDKVHHHDFGDEMMRGRDTKRRERDRDMNWERYPPEPSDRYRERDRDKERDWGAKDYRSRDRDKDRNARERDKMRDIKSGGSRSPCDSGRERRDVHKRPPSPASPERISRPRTPPPIEQEKKPSKARSDEIQDRMEESHPRESGKDDPFEPLTPEHSPSEMYNISDGEIQEGENLEDDPYEEIISEEEDMSDIDERGLEMGEMEYDLCDDAWNSMTSFNPFQCELGPLQHFRNPRTTEFEVIREKIPTLPQEELHEDSEKLLELLKQFSDKDHQEKWVEAVETIASSMVLNGLAYIPKGDIYDSTVETLVSWLKEALNFDLALRQPQTPYKVRHMKAGLRFATSLFQSSKEIIEILLRNSVTKLVLELYNKPYMSLPVKLLIIRTLDAVIFTSEGIFHFLNEKFPVEDDDKSTPDKTEHIGDGNSSTEKEQKTVRWMTGYQYLVEIMMAKQSTRAVVALSSLMKKLHLYEVLQELGEVVEKILQGTVEVVSPKGGDVDTDSDHGAATVCGVPAGQIETAVSCLNEITRIHKNAYRIIAQPLRYLPAQHQFEVTQSPFNPYPGIFRLFQDGNFLESIFVLVSSPSTAGHSGILTSIRELVVEMIQSSHGVQFLASNFSIMNGINRALLQAVDENREESGEDGIAHQLGLQLTCVLQAFQYIDTLLSYHSKVGPKKEIDEPEAVTSLQQLYCMTFTLVGKSAVISLLAMDANLDSLLPFVEMTGDEEFNMKLSKSVCCAYATELLLLTIHHSESISLLQQFSQKLLALSQQELTPKLQEFAQWMLPTKKIPNYTHEAIPQLVTIIKKCAEEPTLLSPELIMSLRILQHLVLPHDKDDTELKYKYGIVHVFSSEGLASFILILQKLCDTFLKPSHQAVSLVGQQGVLVLAIIKPVVAVMQLILSYLVSCRGTEFKDLTAVPVLLRLHTLVSLYPMTWYMYSAAQQVQSSIVETLLAYTQPSLRVTESEEALGKSLWTQMVGEILKYTVTATGTYMTGFTLLSELLPLPLPLQTKEPLTAQEVTKAINTRKLWSAHLLPLSDGIRDIIIGIAATSCQPLQQLLRRVCVQLADLASPTTIVVVRAVLDALYEHLETSPPGTEEDKEQPEQAKPCVSSAARILNFLSYVASHATFKIALLHILKGSVKLDEKYSDVLSKLLSLLNCTSPKTSHLHAQECIVSILQSLCDPDISLVTIESGESVQDVLANSLPHKDILMQITTTLLQHVGNSQHSFASVLPSIRTLVMLTEHDIGFLCVKNAMDSNKSTLHSLFVRLGSSFSKDSSDCLSTLSTSLELLRLMVQVYEEGLQLTRTLLLPASELARYLKWSKKVDKESEEAKEEKPEENQVHPLLELEKLVMECCSSEEEVLESLLENISGIICILNDGADSDKPPKDYPEVVLPSCENLASQFASRTIYVVGDVDEDRLSSSYWLGMPGVDDVEQEPEQVPTDLVSVMEKFCHDFDLKQALDSLCLAREDGEDLDRKSSKRKYPPLANPGSTEAPSKKPFIAPMRGRGFPRGSMHSSRANDPFRSRPPNTSRPPSMHVDDFLAMESHHPSSDGGASGSKRSLKVGPPSHRVPSNYGRATFTGEATMAFQDTSRGRGRGFEAPRGFGSTRGRFFSPPGPYSRREATSRANNSAQRPLPRTPPIPMPSMWGMRSGQGSQIVTIKSQNAARMFPRNSMMERPPISQRSRDPYGLILGGNIPITGGERFARSPRGGSNSTPGGMQLGTIPLNWSDSRNKTQDGRFVVPSGSARGRRDIMNRHARSFTR